MTTNQFNLSRYIPEDIKLEIRRRSKFGCVVCRCGVYQYEHILPEFRDATEHDPSMMCLLCGQCHDRVTRGRLSKQTIMKEYQLVQLSDSVKRPYEELDLSTKSMTITIGSATFNSPECILMINDEPILSVTPPKDGSAFPTISGVFYDRHGNESFRITENEWEGPTDAWDIQVVGKTITVKTENDCTALKLDIDPPQSITISELNMFKDNCHILCDDGFLKVGQTNGVNSVYMGCEIISNVPRIGVCVDSRSHDLPRMTGLRITSEHGAVLNGTGIRFGVGSRGVTLIRNIKVWQY